MKAGFIAILGRPNVGKSTLLNALLSKKVSIVTPRAQTTRDAIMGILNEKDHQYVFVDTPGIFSGSAGLDREMRKSAFASSRDVNLILYLIDASVASLDTDFAVYDSIRSEAPRLIVLNKIDLVRPERGIELKEQIASKYPSVAILDAAIKENFGIKEIKDAIEPYLEEGEALFPEGTLTDKDMAYQAKEVIREKLLHFLHQEIPHQAAVKIDRCEETQKGVVIEATIFLEKANHKGIVIGKGGEMIRKIGVAVRTELGRMWKKKIASLRIEATVEPGWRNDPRKLAELGYGE